MNIYDRIGLLLQSGEGFSAEVIGAITGLDTGEVAAYMGNPRHVLSDPLASGGGGGGGGGSSATVLPLIGPDAVTLPDSTGVSDVPGVAPITVNGPCYWVAALVGELAMPADADPTTYSATIKVGAAMFTDAPANIDPALNGSVIGGAFDTNAMLGANLMPGDPQQWTPGEFYATFTQGGLTAQYTPWSFEARLRYGGVGLQVRNLNLVLQTTTVPA